MQAKERRTNCNALGSRSNGGAAQNAVDRRDERCHVDFRVDNWQAIHHDGHRVLVAALTAAWHTRGQPWVLSDVCGSNSASTRCAL